MRYDALIALLLIAGGPSCAQAYVVELPGSAFDALDGPNVSGSTSAASLPCDPTETAPIEHRSARSTPGPLANADIASRRQAETTRNALDWIGLLRRARDKKREGHKRADGLHPSPRSAESSLEIIEMMRRAKDSKASGK